MDLLEALFSHAAEAPNAEDEYFWVGECVVRKLPTLEAHATPRSPSDVFVVNQHKTATRGTDWFKTAFAEAVAKIGHTLLVLQPWHAPLPLTRSWCLWEIHSTLGGSAELHIVLSPAQRKAFQEALVRYLLSLVLHS